MKLVHIVSGKPHNGTYFKCATQHMGFEESNCFDCLNYRSVDNKVPLCKCKKNDGEGGFGCAIMDMFLLYQDKMTEEMRQTLIKDYECSMRLTEKQAKLRQSEVYKRIEQENTQLRKGLVQGKLFDGGEL